MRDYLYVWHEPLARRLVVSGIEFRDVVPELASAGGVVLLRHEYGDALLDRSGFEFVPADGLAALAGDNIYGYGDFCWADFGRGVVLGELTDQAVAGLTFFTHAARPLGEVGIPGLGNRFLWHAHDDGWHARAFYTDWGVIEGMLGRLLGGLLVEDEVARVLPLVRRGEGAYWCRRGVVRECERTEDIDALLREYLEVRE